MKETMLQYLIWTVFSETFAKALESELAMENPKEVMKAADKGQNTTNPYDWKYTVEEHSTLGTSLAPLCYAEAKADSARFGYSSLDFSAVHS